MMRVPRAACTLAAWLVLSVPIVAQQAPAPPRDEPEVEGGTAHPPHRDTGKTYKGRTIAEVMSYLGADWLVRGSREAEEQPEAMLDALQIAPGSTVADVGAGVGYTSLRLARRVGPEGTVLATDVQPQMIKVLTANLRAAGVRNVKPILCTPTDPKLPEGQVDLVLMVDVYHECSDPEATLRGMRKALKPGGRLVLVEFRGEDPEVPIKPEHKMTVAQVRKEIEPQGFAFKGLRDFLPWQHILVFEKPADDAAGPPPGPSPPSSRE
jgi:SAM-dependent methyltransferase